MPEVIRKLDDVFGVSRDLPLNYVERKSVDEQFINDLSVDKHVIIYGSRKTVENRFKLVATISTKLMALLSAKAGGEYERGSSKEEISRPLEIDPGDPNDLVNALESIGFSKYIVLEDFHYLPRETQENYAFFLKTIHERSKICFIIVAVWREENRLILFNGDLGGRVVSVDADAWTEGELQEVIRLGEIHLNIVIPIEFKAELIRLSLGSVYIVHESCRRLCAESNIRETMKQSVVVVPSRSPEEYVKEVVQESGARYQSFLSSFAGGFQDTQLEMYKWLLFPILTSSIEDLEKGIKYRYIRESLEQVHPKGASLNPGNVTQALSAVPALQSKKNIKPFVLDYDQSNLRLSVVDRGFLIWLSTKDIPELLESLDITHPT